jgi:hypothetical protein
MGWPDQAIRATRDYLEKTCSSSQPPHPWPYRAALPAKSLLRPLNLVRLPHGTSGCKQPRCGSAPGCLTYLAAHEVGSQRWPNDHVNPAAGRARRATGALTICISLHCTIDFRSGAKALVPWRSKTDPQPPARISTILWLPFAERGRSHVWRRRQRRF